MAAPRIPSSPVAGYRSKASGCPSRTRLWSTPPLFRTLGAASDLETPGQQLFGGFWMGMSERFLQVARPVSAHLGGLRKFRDFRPLAE